MIPNKEKEGWHYLAVKKPSTLLSRITKHHGDFYCLTCLHFVEQNTNLSPNKNASKNNDFCGIVMPSENDNILEFNQRMKSDKMPYITPFFFIRIT